MRFCSNFLLWAQRHRKIGFLCPKETIRTTPETKGGHTWTRWLNLPLWQGEIYRSSRHWTCHCVRFGWDQLRGCVKSRSLAEVSFLWGPSFFGKGWGWLEGLVDPVVGSSRLHWVAQQVIKSLGWWCRSINLPKPSIYKFHFVISRATVCSRGCTSIHIFSYTKHRGVSPANLTTSREALAGCRLQIYRRALYVNGKESPGIFVEGSNASLDPSATAPRIFLWDFWRWSMVDILFCVFLGWNWKDSLVLETAMSRNSNYMGLTEVCCSPSMQRWWCRFDGEVPLNPRRGDDVWPVFFVMQPRPCQQTSLICKIM